MATRAPAPSPLANVETRAPKAFKLSSIAAEPFVGSARAAPLIQIESNEDSDSKSALWLGSHSIFGRFPGLAPGRFDEVEHGVPGEGEHVEGGERHGQIGLAMAEIVFEFVAMVFQDVEAFVLDLPPRAAAADDLRDVGFCDRQRSDHGRLIFHGALGV